MNPARFFLVGGVAAAALALLSRKPSPTSTAPGPAPTATSCAECAPIASRIVRRASGPSPSSMSCVDIADGLRAAMRRGDWQSVKQIASLVEGRRFDIGADMDAIFDLAGQSRLLEEWSKRYRAQIGEALEQGVEAATELLVQTDPAATLEEAFDAVYPLTLEQSLRALCADPSILEDYGAVVSDDVGIAPRDYPDVLWASPNQIVRAWWDGQLLERFTTMAQELGFPHVPSTLDPGEPLIRYLRATAAAQRLTRDLANARTIQEIIDAIAAEGATLDELATQVHAGESGKTTLLFLLPGRGYDGWYLEVVVTPGMSQVYLDAIRPLSYEARERVRAAMRG